MTDAAFEAGGEVNTYQGGRPTGTTNAETVDRRRRVARLLATRGAMSATEISRLIGTSLSTATRDLAAIKEEWRLEMIASTDAVIARDLAELGMVKQEAWRVYAMSLDHKPKVVTEQESATGVMVTTTTMDPKPDLNALKLVESCIEKKRKILGLDKEEPRGSGPKSISFTVRIGERVLISRGSDVEEDDIVDAEMVELDSQGKALPSGDQGK